jgi:hypothetical protein
MNKQLEILNDTELDELNYSEEYAEYIMNNSGGDRVICNGDTLLQAQEDGYLFAEFLESLGFCME